MARKKRPHKHGDEKPLDPAAAGWDDMADSFNEFRKVNLPQSDAERLFLDAMETDDYQQCASLLQQVLALDPDFVSAWCALADNTPGVEEALPLYDRGMEAAERLSVRTAAPEAPADLVDDTGRTLYLQVLVRSAQRLYAEGRFDAAAERYRKHLRMAPAGESEVHNELALCLVNMDADDELRQLMQQHTDDDSAHAAYNRALLAYRQQGDTPAARELLRQAVEVNDLAPSLLLGDEDPPDVFDDQVDYLLEEAIDYAEIAMTAWRHTSGANTWMRRVLGIIPDKPFEGPPPAWKLRKRSFARLPQAEELWQVDVLRDDGAEGRHWITLIATDDSPVPLAMDVQSDRPKPAEVWELLLEAMQSPKWEEPRRPDRIFVRRRTLANSWRARLSQIGIECAVVDELPAIDHFAEEAREMVASQTEQPAPDFATLRALPLAPETVWQADVVRLPTWMRASEGLFRPWLLLVVDKESGMILQQSIVHDPPKPETFWQAIAHAMGAETNDEQLRPGTIEIGREAMLEALEARFDSLGIESRWQARLDQLDDVVGDLADELADQRNMSAMSSVPGVKEHHLAPYYDAAANFYRRQPWRQTPADTVIQIERADDSEASLFAIIMGQGGRVLGLSLYESREDVERLFADMLNNAGRPRVASLSHMYGEAFELHPRDLHLIERHHWPIATPEAYPFALRVHEGHPIRAPLAWELELLTPLLQILPDYVADQMPDRQTYDVRLRGEATTITLRRTEI